MSENELSRIRGDLAVMQRAMGLYLPYGKGMLVFGTLFSVTAVGAAVFSLLVEDDRLQLTSLATILVLGSAGAYLQSRRNVNLSPENSTQVILSVCVYAVVWVASCGYVMATTLGPSVGPALIAGLYCTSVVLLLAFSVALVRSALRSRERYYCLGLATSTLLAGTLLPIFDPHYSYPLAHCLMAVGYLTGVAIQWVQLREAVGNHAAD